MVRSWCRITTAASTISSVCLDHGDMISHSNGHVTHHSLLLVRIKRHWCDVTARTVPAVSQQSSGSPKWAALSLHHGFVSINCAFGISTVLALSSIRITPVGLARSLRCHSRIPSRLNRCGPPLLRDRDFDGLVDEPQLLGFQAPSEPSAPVASQRLVCHSCCSRAASVESPPVCAVCHPIVLNSCVVISGSFSTTLALLLALLSASSRPALSRIGCPFHPLWVRSFRSLFRSPFASFSENPKTHRDISGCFALA